MRSLDSTAVALMVTMGLRPLPSLISACSFLMKKPGYYFARYPARCFARYPARCFVGVC